MKLILTTMDHIVPFTVKVSKETADERFLEVTYQNKQAAQMQIFFDNIIVDKKKNLIKKVTGSQKDIGKVEIELTKVSISQD